MKKRTVLIFSLLLIFLAGSIPAGYVYASEKNWKDVIYPGVYIQDIDVSGKQKKETEELLQEKYGKPLNSKKIEVYAGEKTYTLDYSKLEARYNITEVVSEALNYGKTENIINRYKLIKKPRIKQFSLEFTYDSRLIEDFVNNIEKEINTSPVNASIAITDGEIKITPETNGIKLEKDKLKKVITEQINGEVSQEYVKIEALLEPTKPEITSEKLSSINSKISSFSTNFSTSNANRINNIALATKAINGILLMPGESFSFNKTVGERTRERGYKEAGVIIGDKLESGLGGGICQVSSTLYAALLHTDIKTYGRINHTLPLAYISKGLDATVDWGNIDFKFKNTLEVPMYLEGYIKDKNVFFNVYSNQELSKKSYEIVTEIYDTLQPSIKYTEDPNRYEGEEVIVKRPSAGYKVKVYRRTYESGSIINTELISKDTYIAVNGEVIRGTKKRN